MYAGKLLENLLKFRLNAAIENAGGLSERQYRFRAGRLTIGAINQVLTNMKAVQSGSRFSMMIVLLATLDVRNVFNSLRWVEELDALRTKFAIPGHLVKIMQSYLRDRDLIHDTNQRRRRKYITTGATQVSILGPDL